MAHQVETMAYAGELPWHGLGKEVPADLSPERGRDRDPGAVPVRTPAPGRLTMGETAPPVDPSCFTTRSLEAGTAPLFPAAMLATCVP